MVTIGLGNWVKASVKHSSNCNELRVNLFITFFIPSVWIVMRCIQLLCIQSTPRATMMPPYEVLLFNLILWSRL